ncbi:MAG: discoidin domain-containing protein [Limisphaerales bacterium]
MRRGSLLTNVVALAVGSVIFVTCIAGAVEQSTEPIPAASPARLDGGSLTLEAREQSAGVVISLKDSRGIEYAGGMACYRVELKNGKTIQPRAVITLKSRDHVVVTARSAEIELTHDLAVLSGKAGFLEQIRVVNTGSEPLEIEDYRFGLRRPHDAGGELRAVAVPFRRQADGRLRDWSLEEIGAGKGSNSDWQNDAAAARPPVVDSARGRLRSEGWILTDGRTGLLVAKYNQEEIEFSMLEWEGGPTPSLVLGGSGARLYSEPESMRSLAPGQAVSLGSTYYLFVEGGWPAGYERFRRLLNDLGHGLAASYDPPVNWNELFDVGWYHSDAEELAKHYTRSALLGEAEKAADIGAKLLYLDPGWEVCEGTSLWGEDRLGTVSSLVQELRDHYGLGLGFRTIGRVYRDEFPRDWYRQPTAKAQPYERPCLNRSAAPEPVPDKDERGSRNLALLPEARAEASSVLPGFAIHQVEHLNDGWYGNSASWISAGEPSWAQIDLGSVHRVDKVRIGSEHTPQFGDRAATAVRILLAERPAASGSGWRVVAERRGQPIRQTTTFTFAPQEARIIRVEVGASENGNVRLDEIEVYEAAPHPWEGQPRRRTFAPETTPCEPIPFWEVCTQNPAWQQEKLARLERIAGQGMRFMMFDEFDWRGPCYAPNHGHPVPSTPEGHVRAVYGLIHQLKQRAPGILVEAHDPVWPWGVRYLPIYFDQTLDASRRKGSYEENWGFEFMWRPIEDLLSGRALCLYYYNLACDIPLYDHITAEYDNDACLGFWWYASTIRHLGIGGKKGLDSKQINESRWQAYLKAMAQYGRVRDWLVRGRFVGIDEWTHLHVLAGRPGGVLVAFNMSDRPVERTIVLKAADLGLGAGEPKVSGARATRVGDGLQLSLSIAPRSPLVVEIAGAVAPVTPSGSASPPR